MDVANRGTPIHLTAVAALALCVAAPTEAQQLPVTRPPIESFFKLPQFQGAVLNPSATHLAYIREVEGRWNLLVMDLATRALKNIAGYDNADVIEFFWLDDQRLKYTVLDVRVGIGDSDKFAMFAVERDGSRAFTLRDGALVGYSSGIAGRARSMPSRAYFHARVGSGDRSDFIAIEYSTTPFRSSLMRINSRNGLRTAIDPGGLRNVVGWALDKDDVARAVVTQNEGVGATHVRESATAPWRKVGEFDLYAGDGVMPIRIDNSGTLYVSARLNGRDTAAIHRFDWAKGAPEPEPLVSVKDFDIDSGLLFTDDHERLLGIAFDAQTEGTHWLDPKWNEHQQMVDAALPGRVNALRGPSALSSCAPIPTRARRASICSTSRRRSCRCSAPAGPGWTTSCRPAAISFAMPRVTACRSRRC